MPPEILRIAVTDVRHGDYMTHPDGNLVVVAIRVDRTHTIIAFVRNGRHNRRRVLHYRNNETIYIHRPTQDARPE